MTCPSVTPNVINVNEMIRMVNIVLAIMALISDVMVKIGKYRYH